MGKRCLAYHMNVEDNVDIDTADQWKSGEAKKRELLSDVVAVGCPRRLAVRGGWLSAAVGCPRRLADRGGWQTTAVDCP